MTATSPDEYERAAMQHKCPTCKAPQGRWCKIGHYEYGKTNTSYLHSPRLRLGYQARKKGVR